MCLVFYVKSSQRQFGMNQSKNKLKSVSALFCPFFPLLFSDEIPLDAIKSVHKGPLKVHNYRKKKSQSSLSTLESRGSRYVRPRHRPCQRLCRAAAQLIRMKKSQDEGPYVETIMEQGSCAGAIMEALVQSRSSPQPAAQAWAETVWLESWPPPSGCRAAPNAVKAGRSAAVWQHSITQRTVWEWWIIISD